MSVSINMSGIPNSEPAPASAPSPNSNEEIEDEIDTANPPHIQESFLDQLNWTVPEKMGVIKEFLTILILDFILIGLLHNRFNKDQRDFPDSFFQNLYKLLASASGVRTSTETADDSNRELGKILQKLNFQRIR